MRVKEADSDREAEAHVCIDGRVRELEEYGEYMDPTDGAICCYVPIDLTEKAKLVGHFSGTILSISYDAVIDGVLRKASAYTPNGGAAILKRRKLDATKFLSQHKEKIVEASATVEPLAGDFVHRTEQVETIGTMELRVYVARQEGVNHSLGNATTYLNVSKGITCGEIHYCKIKPSFRMNFDENIKELSNGAALREKKKLDTTRPGDKPWAIFRFHYRSKDSIEAEGLEVTLDSKAKLNSEWHELKLDAVPKLEVAVKLPKDDTSHPSRESSKAARSPSTTPIKSIEFDHAPQSPTVIIKNKQTAKIPRIPKSAKKPLTSRDQINMSATVPSAEIEEKKAATGETKVAQLSDPTLTTPSSEQSTIVADATPDIASAAIAPKSDNVDVGTGTVTAASVCPSIKKSITEHATMEEKLVDNDTIVVKVPEQKTEEGTETAAAKAISDPTESVAKTIGKVVINGTGSPKKLKLSAASTASPLTPTAPQKPASKSTVRVVVPVPASTPLPTTLMATGVSQKLPLVPTVPAKRPVPPGLTDEIDVKKMKIVDDRMTLVAKGSLLLRTPSASPSPSSRPRGIASQCAEQRHKLEAIRQHRLSLAKKQEGADKKLDPYKKKMAEELERLNREIQEEEAMAADEDEQFKLSMEMLAELEKNGGD